MLGGGVVLGELVGLHQVHAGEVLVREEDVGQVLAGDVEELGQASAGRHVDGVEALLEQLLGRGHVAHDGVVLKLDAHVLQAVNLAFDDRLGQTELGDAVDQHAAAGEEGLKDGNVKAVTGELAGAGDAGRAGADDSDLLAVLGGHLGRGGELGAVTQEALELADGHGSDFLPRMHLPSHWFSCGQTRPQMAGSMESSRMVSRAPPKSFARICSIKRGMLMLTGQPQHRTASCS